MKIKCDMCNEEVASVFCTADEASLCDGCDRRVHHANKLASKHPRISLLHPSPNSSPLCDICQEKRAFLFCQQDRAILCRDCDVPIHTANEHTQKHDRFLLTGVKLSVDHQHPPLTTKKPALHSFSVSNRDNTNNNNNNMNNPTPINKCFSANSSLVSGGNQGINVITSNNDNDNNSNNKSESSTISEYLMETLPGWLVEDLLDDDLSTHLGFPQGDDGLLLSVGETDHINSYLTSTRITPSKKLGIWVPQAPPSTNFVLPQMGCQNGFKETSTSSTNNVKATRRWIANDLFAVPQINPPSSGSKRSRPSW